MKSVHSIFVRLQQRIIVQKLRKILSADENKAFKYLDLNRAGVILGQIANI